MHDEINEVHEHPTPALKHDLPSAFIIINRLFRIVQSGIGNTEGDAFRSIRLSAVRRDGWLPR